MLIKAQNLLTALANDDVMKASAIASLFLLAAFLFLSATPASGPALSAEAPGNTLHIAGERVTLSSRGGICVVDYRYPRIAGLKTWSSRAG